MFLDLQHELNQLRAKGTAARVEEFTGIIKKGVYVAGVGGFPLTQEGGWTWCGRPASGPFFNKMFREGLGLSGMLTFMNSSSHTNYKLGSICDDLGHDWGEHWMTASLLFVGYEPPVELAIARHGKFKMSWAEGRTAHKLFMASGSIKDWKKYTRNKDDETFDTATRAALGDAHATVASITEGSYVD